MEYIVKTKTGQKKIHQNILFNQFSYNLHCYTEGGSVQGFDVQENVFLNNNNIIGGYKSPDRITYSKNFVFGLQQLATNARGLNATVNENYIFGSVDVAPWSYWENIDFTNNTIMPSGSFKFTRFTTNLANHDIDKNKYRKAVGAAVLNGNLNIEQLRTQYNLEIAGSYEADKEEVWILPNKYAPGRFNVIVYNKDSKDIVNINTEALEISKGDKVIIRNALNYYDEVEEIAVNEDTIDLKMNGRTVAQRIYDSEQWIEDIENYIYQKCLNESQNNEDLVPQCLAKETTKKLKQDLLNSINVNNPYPKHGFFVIEVEKSNTTTLPEDLNEDGNVDLLDIMEMVKELFNGENKDINNDGTTSILDVLYIISKVFAS